MAVDARGPDGGVERLDATPTDGAEPMDSGTVADASSPLPPPECTHYVDSVTASTDWSAASNIATPCTPETALASAQAGDVVCFRGGTYEPGAGPGFGMATYVPANSGESGRPITFMGYPGETALVHEATGDGPSGTAPALGTFRSNYIVWDGFSLQRNLDNGYGASAIVRIEESNNVTVRNCDIAGGAPHRDHTNGVLIMVVHSSYVYIHNNSLHDMIGADSPDEATVNTGAMWIFNQDHIYVHNNDIYNVYNGVQMKVDPNQIYIFANHIWNCDHAAVNLVPQSGSATDFEIYQNVIRDCQVALYSPDPPDTVRNLRFYNNTIYASGASSIANIGSPGYQHHRNTQVWNNIISVGSRSLFLRYYLGLGFPDYSDHNDFHGPGYWNLDYTTDQSTLAAWQTAAGVDASSITGDPGFASAGGTAPADYALGAGSPAAGAGVDRQDHDGDGDTSEAIDMGAFITGSEIIGRVSP